MNADEHKVEEVLKRNERLVVPLYQRQYQWHDCYDGSRTSAIWQDVAAKAGDVLDGRPRFEHYMGALLLAPGALNPKYGTTPVYQVVDGQQRLTTFLILISAIRETANERGYTNIVGECNKFLFNEPGKSDTDELTRFKLTPTPVDREVFFDILDQPLTKVREKYKEEVYWGKGIPKNTQFRALRSYEFFIAQVEDFATNGPGDDTEIDIVHDVIVKNFPAGEPDDKVAQSRLNALLEALVFHLKLIVITLDEKDDAQVIFETLNSAGQPLLAMDLVRNNIFHRAEAQFINSDETEHQDKNFARVKAESLYKEVWAPFDDAWWREPAPNARPRRPRIDHFLAHVLTAETGERTTVRELYAEYRSWAMPNRRPRFEDVKDELAVLKKFAPTYNTLEANRHENDDDETIAWLGERFRLWQNTTAYPIVFQIANCEVDRRTREAIAKLLDSFLTRRALCDLTPKSLNRLFPRLANAFRHNDVSIETLSNFFDEQASSPTTRFPNDDELSVSMSEKLAYGRIPSRILSDILWQFEIASRTTRTEATARPSQLWVEHVMPVSWKKHWPLHDEAGEPVGPSDPRYWQRETAIHTIGNLTIVTAELNILLKNSPFEKKKTMLIEHSNLTLNHRIANEKVWDETTISERSRTLAEYACEIWPTPMSKLSQYHKTNG